MARRWVCLFLLVCHVLECTIKQRAVERRIKASITAPVEKSLLRKALVTSPSLFFFLLSYVIIFTVFSSPMDQVLRLHLPCSDVTMPHKKNKQIVNCRGAVRIWLSLTHVQLFFSRHKNGWQRPLLRSETSRFSVESSTCALSIRQLTSMEATNCQSWSP